MSTDLAREEFQRGVELLQNRCTEQAYLHIERAFHMDAENPYYVSYMGLTTGLAKRQWGDAEILCQKAVKMRRNLPQFYLNLAEVYRRSGRREDAIAVLQRGLLNTGNAAQLRIALSKLERRSRLAIPFLKRNHAVNRGLGKLRHQFTKLLKSS